MKGYVILEGDVYKDPKYAHGIKLIDSNWLGFLSDAVPSPLAVDTSPWLTAALSPPLPLFKELILYCLSNIEFHFKFILVDPPPKELWSSC